MRSRMWLRIGFLGLLASISAPAWGADHDPLEKAATTVNGAATTAAGGGQDRKRTEHSLRVRDLLGRIRYRSADADGVGLGGDPRRGPHGLGHQPAVKDSL